MIMRQLLDKLTCVPVVLGLIVPGQGVGPVTVDMERGDLYEVIGESHLEDIAVHIGEGFTMEGTSVWAGTDSALVVVWNDLKVSGMFEIRVTGPAWRTEEGLHTGMLLTEVDSIIGEFGLLGFAWDYEGYCDLSGTGMPGGILLRFDAADLSEESDWEAMAAVSGDILYSSRDPEMVVFNPVLDVIMIRREEP